MNEARATIVRHRLSRAAEALEEATILATEGHTLATVSRLYYAVFYAARALLATKGIERRSHSGIISEFDRVFVKSRVVERAYSRTLHQLAQKRTMADYADFAEVEPAEVMKWLNQAEDFVGTITKLCKQLLAESE